MQIITSLKKFSYYLLWNDQNQDSLIYANVNLYMTGRPTTDRDVTKEYRRWGKNVTKVSRTCKRMLGTSF